MILGDLVIVQNDRHKDSFLAAFDLATGKQVWRTTHDEYPSWATPAIVRGPLADRASSPTPASTSAASIRKTGRELWRLSDNMTQVKVPTPIVAGDLVIVTGGYPAGGRPIYAIRPGGSRRARTRRPLAWQTDRGSPVHRHAAPLRRHPLRLHRQRHPERLRPGQTGDADLPAARESGRRGGFSASPIAADGESTWRAKTATSSSSGPAASSSCWPPTGWARS